MDLIAIQFAASAAALQLTPLAAYRRAFQFLWDQEDVQEQPSNFFERLFGASEPTFSPPKTDMRALDGLENILKKAGVFE